MTALHVRTAPLDGDPQSADRLTVESFHALYAQQLGAVCNVLRRFGAPASEIEDLAHEVFVTALGRLDSYRSSRPVQPWLFGIAFRVVSHLFERQKTRQWAVERDAEPRPSTDASAQPDEQLAQAQLRRRVLRALEALDLDRRAVFVMHDIEELPAPEISRALGVPLNTVYSRLRSARRLFSEAYERQTP